MNESINVSFPYLTIPMSHGFRVRTRDPAIMSVFYAKKNFNEEKESEKIVL